jgi:hypothetical protein
MDANKPDLNVNSQQLLGRVLKSAAEKKQVVLAELLEWDKAKVSKVLSCQQSASLDDVLLLLAACDLAVIPAEGGETVCMPADRYRALLVLAGERMDALRGLG